MIVIIKKIYIYGITAAFLSIGLLTSCSYGNMEADINPDEEENSYFALDIYSPELISESNGGPSTRGTDEEDYEDGSDKEHDLSSLLSYAILFDENGIVSSVTLLRELEKVEIKNGYEKKPYEEYAYRGVVSLKKNEWPKYCFLVLNCYSQYNELRALKGESIEYVKKALWTEQERKLKNDIGFDNMGHFTMTNVSYVEGNEVKNLTDIPADLKYWPTVEEAKKSDSKVTVYVERMVAKFETSFKYNEENKIIYRPYNINQITIATYSEQDDDGNPNFNYIPYNWEIEVLGWGMNGLETSSRFFKYIQTPQYFPGGNVAQYFPDWNDAANKRSYWSEDPHYTSGVYPLQYRRAYDLPAGETRENYSSDENNGFKKFSLRYFSFNEFCNQGIKNFLYTPENTFINSTELDSQLEYRGNLIAGTHLLVLAQLCLNNPMVGSEYGPVSNLYGDRIGVYYLTEKEAFAGFVRAINRKLESQADMQYKYYDWTGADTSENETTKTYNSSGKLKLWYVDGSEKLLLNWETIGQLEEKFKKANSEKEYLFSIQASVKNGDGKRLPWIDGLKILDENGNLPKDNDGKEIDLSLEDLKSVLYEWYGAWDHFNDGKMYYAIPVMHSPKSENGIMDVYGVVRNHLYKFNVVDVIKFGVPIDNPDEPIIPNEIIGHDQLKVDAKIIAWHFIDLYVGL